jgi:nitrate reductase beta subunit
LRRFKFKREEKQRRKIIDPNREARGEDTIRQGIGYHHHESCKTIPITNGQSDFANNTIATPKHTAFRLSPLARPAGMPPLTEFNFDEHKSKTCKSKVLLFITGVGL